MKDSIFEQMLNRTTFLVGNKKNAGKTTFFNYAISQVREHATVAFMTIGVDGEMDDVIDNKQKPFIYTTKGDYIVTTGSRLNQSDASFAIHHVFPYKTALGNLVLAQTIRGGNVELVGSEDNAQLTEIIHFLKTELFIDTILIDGAANRTTQVASVKNSFFCYILRIDHETLHSDFNKLRALSLINTFPCVEEIKDIHLKKVFEITGAFTESKKGLIPYDCEVLLVNDFTKIFLELPQIERLCSKLQIAYKIKYSLTAFVIILKNIQRNDFQQLLGKYKMEDKFIMNPYEC